MCPITNCYQVMKDKITRKLTTRDGKVSALSYSTCRQQSQDLKPVNKFPRWFSLGLGPHPPSVESQAQLPWVPRGWDRAAQCPWSPLPPTPGLSSLPDCPPIPSFSMNPFILWLFDSPDHPGLLRLSLSVMTELMGPGAQAVVSTTPRKAQWLILWLSGVSLKETWSSPEKEGDHPLCSPLCARPWARFKVLPHSCWGHKHQQLSVTQWEWGQSRYKNQDRRDIKAVWPLQA